jgi:hypothetical protein
MLKILGDNRQDRHALEAIEQAEKARRELQEVQDEARALTLAIARQEDVLEEVRVEAVRAIADTRRPGYAAKAARFAELLVEAAALADEMQHECNQLGAMAGVGSASSLLPYIGVQGLALREHDSLFGYAVREVIAAGFLRGDEEFLRRLPWYNGHNGA